MKILFFGSSSYCLPILDSLQNNFKLIGIVTKPDSIVHQFAQKNHIRSLTPPNQNHLINLKKDLEQLHPYIAIVADFGLIIPAEIFNIPQHKTLNIHFSRLPDLRGASPVQFTILRGDPSAWISIIIMDEGLDTGDIIWQKLALQGQPLRGYNAQDLYKKLFNIISVCLPDIIDKYTSGKLKRQKQDHSKATFTKILTRYDGYIPWNIINLSIQAVNPTEKQLTSWSLLEYLRSQLLITNYQLPVLIERASRALFPWPGLWTEIKIKDRKKRLKILKVRLPARNAKPSVAGGQLTTYLPRRQAGNLQLVLVQLEGKKPVSWKQFQEGYQNTFSKFETLNFKF